MEKPFGTIVFGVSPAWEMGLYTAVFLTDQQKSKQGRFQHGGNGGGHHGRPQGKKIKVGDIDMEVRCHELRGGMGTCFVA